MEELLERQVDWKGDYGVFLETESLNTKQTTFYLDCMFICHHLRG